MKGKYTKALGSATLLAGLLIALVGVISMGVLLGQRVSLERADRSVDAAITWSDLEALAQASGQTTEQWLSGVESLGYVILTPDQAADDDMTAVWTAAGLDPVWLGDPADFSSHEEPALVIPEDTLSQSGEGRALALVENDSRTGVVLPQDLLDGGPQALRDAQWEPVKTLKLYDDYRNRWTEEDGGLEIEALLFRAVTDRSQRLLWLTPFTDSNGTLIADSGEYEAVLTTLAGRLEERGYTFGDGFSIRETRPASKWLIGGAALVVVVLAVLALGLLFPALTPGAHLALLGAGTVGCLGLCLILPLSLFQTLASLGAAVVVPTIAAVLLVRHTTREKPSPMVTAVEYPIWMAAVTAGSVLGGLLIGALLATEDFLLEYRVFAGVKAAEFTPVLLFILLVLWSFRAHPLRSEGRSRMSAVLILAAGIVVAAVILVLLLLRSGDGMLAASQLETAIRDWLERALYARPRTKEFAAAWPALAAFLWAGQRRLRLGQLPFGLLAVIGSVSVVNTFCHLYTPLHVSLIRVLLGFGLGLVLGYVTLLILTGGEYLLSRRRQNI